VTKSVIRAERRRWQRLGECLRSIHANDTHKMEFRGSGNFLLPQRLLIHVDCVPEGEHQNNLALFIRN